jgi:hypothetical protein
MVAFTTPSPGLLRHVAGTEGTSADSFLPILIYVILRANPPNLLSNVEWVVLPGPNIVCSLRSAYGSQMVVSGIFNVSGPRISCKERLDTICRAW